MFMVCLPMAEYRPQEGRNYVCLMPVVYSQYLAQCLA